MIRYFTFSIFLIFIILDSGPSKAQTASDPINYQVRYDEPFNIKKLFAHFQPLYGEVASTNMSIGFGVEFDYYLENRMDFSLHFRKPYGQATDLMRDAAINNAENTIKPKTYKYLELGGTYHWKDFEEENPTKVFLYKKQYKGTKLSSHVIQTTEVISKVRKIYGARLGGYFTTTTFDLNRTMENQSTVLVDSENNTIDTDASLFGNLTTAGLYLGASMTWIRNFAIDFEDEYEPGGDDLLLTTFFDFLIAPSVNVDDILYNDVLYSSNSLKKSNIGFRLGAEGKFNRELGWGYGVEIGLRPGLSNQGFFSVLKLSFPIYTTDLKYSKVESTEMSE